jgi:hypothetical protein
MDCFVFLDTLYLSVKYPKQDIYQKFFPQIDGVDYRKLKAGIVSGDFVLKGGASLYRFSVCQHDARIFLTDRVDEIVGEGNGSGIWVQLGPKFLIQHINDLHRAVKKLLRDVGVKGDYPIKITRLDLAMDLLGIAISSFKQDDWIDGWVGRSKPSAFHLNSRTGILETINIGSRKSAVFLRIYDKVAQAVKEGDIKYWRDAWKGFSGSVTRIEWEVKPNEGYFGNDLKQFELFSGFALRELLVYLLTWGRLCIPDPDDSNNRRWEETEFWKEVKKCAETWLLGVDWPTSRYGKEFHGVSEHFIKQASGVISSAMARLSVDEPDLMHMFEELNKYGESLEKINKKAAEKAAIISRM